MNEHKLVIKKTTQIKYFKDSQGTHRQNALKYLKYGHNVIKHFLCLNMNSSLLYNLNYCNTTIYKFVKQFVLKT